MRHLSDDTRHFQGAWVSAPAHSGGIPHRRDPAGFTLIEVLVAMTLAAIVIWLTYTIFSSTSGAVRTSLARSTVLQGAYATEMRLRMDFNSMIGPSRADDSAAGALIVVHALRAGTLPVAGNPTGKTIKQLRSDQVVFFFNDTKLSLKSQTQLGVRSHQAKIWLGHVQMAAGEPPLATQWTLGRQSTLLTSPSGQVRQTAASGKLPRFNVVPDTTPEPNFDNTTVLSPESAASQTGDVAPYSLEEVANWMRALGTPSAATDLAMVKAFAVDPSSQTNAPSGSPSGQIVDATHPLGYTNLPKVETQPLADNNLTPSDMVNGSRVFLANCSEFYVQYTTDNRVGAAADGLPNAQNGLIDTDGTTDGDYSGNIAWFPDDKDIFDATRPGHTAAMAPAVFYPTDDQARLWHIGSYQGTDSTKYNQNKFGDWTPYPAVTNPTAASPAIIPSGTYNFGDALTIDSGTGLVLPAAAALARYQLAMKNYADHHGTNSPLNSNAGTASGPCNGPPAQTPFGPAVPTAWDPAAHPAPWQKPQSQWPQLLRIRYRLHDTQGTIFSYNDDLATNKRDDDGDGTVDNAAENRCSGLWFEHIFAMPYPRPN